MTTPNVTVREWTDLVRRARLGRTTKAVALMLATYADYTTGRRVRPGLPRLAIDCELGYKAVQDAMRTLRETGLIELVRPAARRGESDEYRLAIGEDLLERLEILSPAAVKAAAAKLGQQRQGRYRPSAPADPDPDGGGGADPDLHPVADGADPTHLHPAPNGAGPVDNSDLRPVARGADPNPGPNLHPAPRGAEPDLHPFSRPTCTPRRDPPSPIDLLTKEIPQLTMADVDLTVTPSRATRPPDNPPPPSHDTPDPPGGCGRRNCADGWLALGINRVRCHVCQPQPAHTAAGSAS